VRPFRERNPIVVGAISLAVIGVVIAFAFSLDRMLLLRGVYLIEADFADAAGIAPENEVRVAGLRVGEVRTVELAGPDGGSDVRDRVRVTMEIERGVQLGGGTTAEIKLRTILGAKFVELTPSGGEPLLEPGDRIDLDRTRVPFELYEAQDATVATLGEIDAEALNEALGTLVEITDDPDGNLGRALDGLARATEGLADHEVDLEELIRDSEVVLRAVGDRSEELERILVHGSDVLGSLADRRESLRAFIRATDRLSGQLSELLASTRGDLDPALQDLHIVLGVVRANLGNLEEIVRVLAPDAEAFARPMTKGPWVEVYTASVLGLPLPPGVGLEDLLGITDAPVVPAGEVGG
jgi:phospholipid/cholesterol/gamma-HCH transport system substrate-binding protein